MKLGENEPFLRPDTQADSRKISCWGNSLPLTQVSCLHASDNIKLGISKVGSICVLSFTTFWKGIKM